MKEQIAELQKALSDSHLALYDEKSFLLQLTREHQLMVQQEASDKKKMEEVQALSEEVSQQDQDEEPEETANYINYKDVRPESLAKKFIQKNKNLKPEQNQQSVLTNQLIQEKMAN